MLSNFKSLVIYPYLISNNLLKEILTRVKINVTMTNNVEKASLIIGLKKDMRQNLKLKELAKRKKIPIYSLNQISIYQLIKLVDHIKKND